MRLLERLPRESGGEYALRTIKENIINLELPPGSQISENELAAEMGLSRTPVREALIELSKVKIVDVQPQKKSSIPLIDYDMVEESRFMRDLLECAVVELDCEMAGPADLERLDENVRLQSLYMDDFYSVPRAAVRHREKVPDLRSDPEHLHPFRPGAHLGAVVGEEYQDRPGPCGHRGRHPAKGPESRPGPDGDPPRPIRHRRRRPSDGLSSILPVIRAFLS